MNRKLFLLPFLLLAVVYTGYAQVPVGSIAATPSSGCAPLAVAFNGSATGPGPYTWSWSFPGGVPATSTLQNVAVLYNNSGTFTATLIVRNSNGNSQAVTYDITVNPIPVAKFTEDKTTGCYPTWINFTNLTTPSPGETITSYLWNFGDGTQSNLPNPSHRYTTGGNINVTLYVNNNFGCTGSAQVANIQKALTLNGGGIFPNFNSSLATSCNLPVTANFSNTTVGPNIKSALWDFGDGGGFSSNIYSPSHSYTAAGTYTVRLAATSTQGCSDTLNLPINITANGNLTDFTVQDTNCVNTQVNFTNISSPNPNSSTWDYGDGSPQDITKNGQHLYTLPGKYTVTLTNTFAGCSGTVSKDIYIVNPPVASFTGTNLNSCKAPLTASFTNTSGGGTGWLWDFGDGTTSNLKNPPPHTYSALGTYQVNLNASTGSGCSSTAAPITVSIQQPTISFNNPQSFFGCAPYTFTPSATITAVDGVASYSWNFGNGNTSTAATAPPQTYGAGSWTITLTVTTTGGCTVTSTATVLVGTSKPTPVNFSFVPPTACVATSVQFTAAPGTANKWFWDFGDGSTDNTNKPNPVYAYPKPGTYNIKLTEYDNGCWDTLSQTIVVNPPLADFKISTVCGAKNSFIFTDNSTGPVTTYLWDFGDGSTSSSVGPITHTYPPGPTQAYNVKLTVSTPTCSNTSPIQTVNANKGVTIYFSKNTVCTNTTVNINTGLPQDPNIYTYLFELGDGGTSFGTASSLNWVYTKPGIYQVKVITTDLSGCVDSSAPASIVVGGPTAKFTAPPALSCGALTFSFTDLSTSFPAGSNIVNWLWDFGDGTTSNIQNPPAHTYSVAGSFAPNLTVTDINGCTGTVDSPVAITVSIPVASFTASEDSSCPNAPNPIRFTNNSNGGFNPVYTWTFGDGTSSTAFSPIYAYPAVGNYNASLSMTDVYGCSSTSAPLRIVVDTPHADFTMSGNYSACPPFNVSFLFTGKNALTYNWDFTDGVGSVIKDPSNLFANPGDYYPNLTITSHGGCISKSDSQHIRIDGPIGTFNYSPLSGCDSLDVTFNVTTTNVVSFTWNFGDGSSLITGTNPTITHHYNIPGQFPPVVTLVDVSGCSVPKIGANLINVDAITKTIFKTDKAIVCDSGVVNFTDTSIIGPSTAITNYVWDFGDGSPVQNGMYPTIAHNYTTIGNYTATMSVTSFGGCTGTYSLPVTVAASPKIAINGLLSQCEPAVLNYSGIETVPDPYGPLNWSWNFGNGQTANGQTQAGISYPKAGEYVVSLVGTNSKGCSMMTDTTKPSHLFIYPIPTVNAGTDVTICDTSSLQLNATGNATSFNWDPPVNGTLSFLNGANPVATSPVSTYFVVQGTSLFGCKAKDTIQVTVNTQVTVNVTGTDSVCLGQSAPLNATGAAIYNWTPAQGLNDPNIASPVATPDASQIGNAPSAVITYTVTGYDNKKCYSDTKSINITAFNYPVIGLTPNATINVGNSYQISSTVTTNVVSLNWTPSNTLSCSNCLTPLATPTKTTKYILTALNDGGCATMDSIRVQVICDGANFFVPNTFSPNGDGVNDNFVVNGIGLNVIPSITIYNRWGQIVFQKSNFAPNSSSEGWDGTFNGQPAPPDVYIYTIQILCNNATLIPYHGNVTLIR